MKILIVEDQINMVLAYRMALVDTNHELSVARNGSEAIPLFQRNQFDAVITDWMMPNQNGIELIRWIRAHVQPAPPIVMITALGLHGAAEKALDAGADEYLVKPIVPDQLLSVLDRLQKRQRKEVDISNFDAPSSSLRTEPRFHAVAIAAGSGAAPDLERLLTAASANMKAAFLVVIHGPDWGLNAVVQKLAQKISTSLGFAKDGQKVETGKIFFAPGNHHMVVHPEQLTIQLQNSEPENFVRPAADPLMRSVARAFGHRSVGVVLGGLGSDGTTGAGFIHTAGGNVIVLDPKEAVVPQMSQNVIDIGMADQVLKMDGIIESIRSL